jgi:selenocysteine lyase/cysteine desulfurase
MKPSTTDYLSITAALVAILLCGYGIGFLVGERTTLNRVGPPPAGGQAGADWSGATVERLKRELALTDAQTAAVEREVALTATEITAARGAAIHQYRLALLALHQRLLPHLDAEQRRTVEKSYQKLKLSLDKPVTEGGP